MSDAERAGDDAILELIDAGLTDTEASREAGLSVREYRKRKARLLLARARATLEYQAAAAQVRHDELIAVLARIAGALEKQAGI